MHQESARTTDGRRNNGRRTSSKCPPAVPAVAAVETSKPMAMNQVKKVSYWHESIVDWELQNPDKSMGDCALHFNVTEPWLSVIRNSDIFREYAALRRGEHNSNVSMSVIDRAEAVAGVSLEVLEERIQNERRTIGLGIVNDTAAMALKALGFGQKQDTRGGGNTQVNIVLGADPELLARAREKMRLANAHREPASVGASGSPQLVELEEESVEQPPRALSTPS